MMYGIDYNHCQDMDEAQPWLIALLLDNVQKSSMPVILKDSHIHPRLPLDMSVSVGKQALCGKRRPEQGCYLKKQLHVAGLVVQATKGPDEL